MSLLRWYMRGESSVQYNDAVPSQVEGAAGGYYRPTYHVDGKDGFGATPICMPDSY